MEKSSKTRHPVDFEEYSALRKAKYSLRNVLKQLDLGTLVIYCNNHGIEKQGQVNVDVLFTVAKDNGIVLSERDLEHLRCRVAVHGKLSIDDVVKDLMLVVRESNTVDEKPQM